MNNISNSLVEFLTSNEINETDDVNKILENIIYRNLLPAECMYYSFSYTQQKNTNDRKSILSKFAIHKDCFKDDINHQIISIIRKYIIDNDIAFNSKCIKFLSNQDKGIIFNVSDNKNNLKGNSLFDYHKLRVNLNKDNIRSFSSTVKQSILIKKHKVSNYFVSQGLDEKQFDNDTKNSFFSLFNDFIWFDNNLNENDFLVNIWGDLQNPKIKDHATCCAVAAESMYPGSSFFISVPKIINDSFDNPTGFSAVFVLKNNTKQNVLEQLHILSHFIADKINKFGTKTATENWMKFICNTQNISLSELLKNKEESIVNDQINYLLNKIIQKELTQSACVSYNFAYKSVAKNVSYQPCIINKHKLSVDRQNKITSIIQVTSIAKHYLLEKEISFSSKSNLLIQQESNAKGIALCISKSKTTHKSNDFYNFFEINIETNEIIKDRLLNFIEKEEPSYPPKFFRANEYDDYVLYCDYTENEFNKRLKDLFYEDCIEYVSELKPRNNPTDKYIQKIWQTENKRKDYCACCTLMADMFGDDYMVIIITPNNVRLLDKDHADIGGLICMFFVKKDCPQDVINKLYFMASTIAEKVITYNLLLSFAPLHTNYKGLSVFSHESGKYFQESGLLTIESDVSDLTKFIGNEDKNSLETLSKKLLTMKKVLCLAWGIQSALSVADKGFREEYFDKEHNYTIEDVILSIKYIIFTVLAGQINSKLMDAENNLHSLANSNIIEINGILFTPKYILDEFIFESISAIPPFKKDSIDPVLAILCGLLELVRNACSQIFAEPCRPYMSNFYKKYNDPLLIFNIDTIANNQDIIVTIKNISMNTLNAANIPKSIQNIQYLEEHLEKNNPIVKTQFNNSCININNEIEVSFTWKYFFNTNPPKLTKDL